LDQENEMQKSVVNMWDAVMNHEINPLKHIDDLQTRHVVMQFLAWMWCIIFSMSLGSWTIFGVSAVAHALLIAGVVATVATFKVAQHRPNAFVQLARGAGGEHE
jgi:hypothetical protein